MDAKEGIRFAYRKRIFLVGCYKYILTKKLPDTFQKRTKICV
jgi:hypothetical protein